MDILNLNFFTIWNPLFFKRQKYCRKFDNEKFVFKISAKNLPSFGNVNFHKADPLHSIFVVVLLKNDNGEIYEEIGRTEMVQHNPHLNWDKTFSVQFFIHQNQKIK